MSEGVIYKLKCYTSLNLCTRLEEKVKISKQYLLFSSSWTISAKKKQKLHAKTSSGLDEIQAIVLMNCPPELIPIVTGLYLFDGSN